MPASKRVQATLKAVLERLGAAVRADARPTAVIEKRAGFTPRYLGQLLRGDITLKLEHVYALLDALGLDPMEFWAAVHGVHPQQQPAYAVLIPQGPAPQLAVAGRANDPRLRDLESRLSRQIQEEIRAALAGIPARKPRKKRPPVKKDDNG